MIFDLRARDIPVTTGTCFCFYIYHKMAVINHFVCPKITFGRISLHFRSIHNFYFLFFTKWPPPKITFDHISRHFRSIHNFVIYFSQIGHPQKSLLITQLTISDQCTTDKYIHFFTKWQSSAILDARKSLLIAFHAISNQYATFFKIATPSHFGIPIFTNIDRVLPLWVIIDCVKYENLISPIFFILWI